MKTIPAIFLGCAVGLGLGWAIRGPGTELRDSSEIANSRSSRSIHGTKSPARGGEGGSGENGAAAMADPLAHAKNDLASLLRTIRLHELEGDPYVVREAERLDTDSLRALVAAMTADSLQRDTQDRFELSLSLKAIATTQFRREGVRALEWASQLPDPKVRELVITQTMRAALTEDPAAALPWFDKLQQDSENGSRRYEWHSAAIMGATSRGVGDLIALRQLYGERLTNSASPTGPFAPDFDFKQLLTEGRKAGLEIYGDEVIRQWALRDRSGAWEMFTETEEVNGQQTNFARGIYSALLATEGYEAAAREALAPFKDASDKDRETMIRAMAYSRYDNPKAVTKTMSYLSEPDQGRLAKEMLTHSSDPSETGPALAAMSSPAMRVEAISNFVKMNPSSNFSNEGKQNDYYEKLMTAAGLTNDEKARIRAIKPDTAPKHNSVDGEVIWSDPDQ